MTNRPLSFEDIPLVLTVEELMPILGIGRNSAYDLVRSGQLRSIRIGKKIRILKQDLQQFLGGRSSTGIPCTESSAQFTLGTDPSQVTEGGDHFAKR